MSVAERDPLAEILDKAPKYQKPTKCEQIFADRPEVLESIRKAYRRKLSFKQIADILSANTDLQIGEGAVRKYLQRVGDAK